MNAYKPKLSQPETELPLWVAIASALILSLFLIFGSSQYQSQQPQPPHPVLPSW